METKDIVLLAICVAAAGFSLYRKYIKNKEKGETTDTGSDSRKPFSSDSGTDDYEPYSGR